MNAARSVGCDRTCRVEHLWGTVITIDVADPIDTEVLDEVVSWFHRVDDLFSTWRDDSDISRIGRGELTIDDASPEVGVVLDLCAQVSVHTNGAFDATFGAHPRVGPGPGLGPLDPSGLVKGWALEQAVDLMAQHGIANVAINAGGDVITRGHPRPDEPWRIGIQHPWQRDKVATVVTGTDLAVATSGRYERGNHIFDPAIGVPATALMAATVVGHDLAIVDGYATAAMVLGPTAMEWLTDEPGIEAMAITNDKRVICTLGFGAS